jgi:hypothetical protein
MPSDSGKCYVRHLRGSDFNLSFAEQRLQWEHQSRFYAGWKTIFTAKCLFKSFEQNFMSFLADRPPVQVLHLVKVKHSSVHSKLMPIVIKVK